MSLLEWVDRPDSQQLRARLNSCGEEVATTIVTYEEQVRGWLGYIATNANSIAKLIEGYKLLKRQLENYSRITLLEFDEVAATKFQHLKKSRLRVGTMDLKIAAIVLAHQATLLTRNTGHFAKVPGLKVEDWIK
jgi:tRNA(fMet)-specific endonuclease VapC